MLLNSNIICDTSGQFNISVPDFCALSSKVRINFKMSVQNNQCHYINFCGSCFIRGLLFISFYFADSKKDKLKKSSDLHVMGREKIAFPVVKNKILTLLTFKKMR